MKGIILYAPAAVPGGIPWHRPPGQVCRHTNRPIPKSVMFYLLTPPTVA